MTDAFTIARSYAKAAFSTATEANQLPLWSDALRNLSIAVEDTKMNGLIKNPAVIRQQLIEILMDVLRKTTHHDSANHLVAIENFIRVLSEKERLLFLPMITDLYEEDSAKAAGYLSLAITSAYSMTDAQKNKVKEKLSLELKTNLHIDYHIDENVVGGLLIRSKHWVLNGTVDNTLGRLRSALI